MFIKPILGKQGKVKFALAALFLASFACAQAANPFGESKEPFTIRAKEVTGYMEGQLSAFGNVEIRQGKQAIFADELRYDRAGDFLTASGNVQLMRPDAVIVGDYLQYEPGVGRGFLTKPDFMLTDRRGRGQASRAQMIDQNRIRMANARFTTCPVGTDDWFLNVREIVFNRTTEVATVKGASLEMFGLPMAYLPYMSFTTNHERKTGLLFPTFSGSGNNGFEVALPFYWNMAPNYDMTITPHLMTKRGLQIQDEFRYLFPGATGILRGEILPEDAEKEKMRYAVNLQHRQSLASLLDPRWNFMVQYEKVSDDDYFNDISGNLGETSQRQLPQTGAVTYDGDYIQSTARVENYQSLLNYPDAYRRLPQFTLSGDRDFGMLEPAFSGEWVHFDHADSAYPTGNRATLYPSLALPLRASYGYIKPKVGAHYTNYDLDLKDTRFDDGARTVPIYSIDSGLTFERQFSGLGETYTQTLEPRLFYLYIPYRQQDDLPIFDTGDSDVYFSQLFRENRFLGGDRINDANDLTFALTSRLLDDQGGERLKMSLGERYYFEDSNVFLYRPTISSGMTDVLAEVSGRLTKAWWLDAFGQYNTNEGRYEKYSAGVRYHPEAGKTLNFGYRYNRNYVNYDYLYDPDVSYVDTGLKQIDLSGQWPLAARWYGLGRINYSFIDDDLLEGLAGLEYDAGCWAARLVTHRYVVNSGSRTRVMFEIELADLAHLGSNPFQVLQRNIPGFEPTSKEESLE